MNQSKKIGMLYWLLVIKNCDTGVGEIVQETAPHIFFWKDQCLFEPTVFTLMGLASLGLISATAQLSSSIQ